MCRFSFDESLKLAEALFLNLGIDSARLDAELLLLHVLKKSKLEFYLTRHELHNRKTFYAFMKLCARRLCHEPIAYIVGHKEFYGHEFVVTRSCLIPRPDTEIIVEECLAQLNVDKAYRVIDLCTGSGAIGLTLAKERPRVTVIATDISKFALRVAKTNAELLSVADRVIFYQGDLFCALPAHMKADLIVSNPPYIASRKVDHLSSTVRDYEPRRALDGAHDGLAFYRKILCDAPMFLVPLGYLILEIGFDQGDALMRMVTHPWMNAQLKKDLSGHNRCLVVQLADDESVSASKR